MTRLSLPARVSRRAAAAGVAIDDELAGRLAAYLDVLARWNRKINLTALQLDPVDDPAVDRLVIEPIIAATYVDRRHHTGLDVGSGNGSPALPLKLARPTLQITLVESKTRKAAFLREAIRQLELRDVSVDNRRLERLVLDHDQYDIVTIRGVRLDPGLAEAIRVLVRPGGRILAFVSATEVFKLPFGTGRFVDLLPERQSRLGIVDIGFPSKEISVPMSQD